MDNNLGKFLKSTRFEKKMSLRDFSEYLGISHAYLNKLEKGVDPRTGKDIAPTMETLTKISDGLNMNINTFLEMCGYLNKKPLSLSEFKNNFELKDFVDEMTQILLSAENITYNGETITQKDTQIIAEALEIGIELALKKHNNKN